MTAIPDDRPLEIGSLVFDGLDQMDLTGPFEVLSRLPNSRMRLYGLSESPVRDTQGLRFIPDAAIADAPTLVQLGMAYAPEPPFASGTPESARPEVLQAAREAMQTLTARRGRTARRFGVSLRGGRTGASVEQ